MAECLPSDGRKGSLSQVLCYRKAFAVSPGKAGVLCPRPLNVGWLMTNCTRAESWKVAPLLDCSLDYVLWEPWAACKKMGHPEAAMLWRSHAAWRGRVEVLWSTEPQLSSHPRTTGHIRVSEPSEDSGSHLLSLPSRGSRHRRAETTHLHYPLSHVLTHRIFDLCAQHVAVLSHLRFGVISYADIVTGTNSDGCNSKTTKFGC